MEIKGARIVVKDALSGLSGYSLADHLWGAVPISGIDSTFNTSFCSAFCQQLGLQPGSVSLDMTLEQVAQLVAEKCPPVQIETITGLDLLFD